MKRTVKYTRKSSRGWRNFENKRFNDTLCEDGLRDAFDFPRKAKALYFTITDKDPGSEVAYELVKDGLCFYLAMLDMKRTPWSLEVDRYLRELHSRTSGGKLFISCKYEV